MRSIKEIFVIGHGPSSSHTMGPAFACEYILKKYKTAKYIEVTLFGSLALTGKGHLTDYIIHQKLKDIIHDVKFDEMTPVAHPNTIKFHIVDFNNEEIDEFIVSAGGGTILVDNQVIGDVNDVYPHKKLAEIVEYCKKEIYSFV